MQDVVILSLSFAEKIRGLEAVIGESFITFAMKVHSLGHDKFQALADLKIKFGNGAYNLTMHKAVVSVATVMTDKMREVISEIENVYGKDVISSSYNKIYRLVCSAEGVCG